MYDRYNLIKKNYRSLDRKYPPVHIGGAISWATEQYKQNVLDGKIDGEMCSLIDGVVVKENEGRNNDGISFVEIEGVRYFVKYHKDLLGEFKNGYYLSKLIERYPTYPYFLNVHALLKCNYMSKKGEKLNGHAMIVDMGTETIHKYMGRHISNYMKKIIPGFEKKTQSMDDSIHRILTNNLITDIDNRYCTITDKCKAEISKVVGEYYGSLRDAFHVIRSDFLPKFMKNYKKILDLFILLDILVLNEYGVYFNDKKADNFMIRTEPYDAGTGTHIEVLLGNTRILFDNTLEWDDGVVERCYIYPVDFGSMDDIVPRDHTAQRPDIPIDALNRWIRSICGNCLYSDNHDTSLADNNILYMKNNMIGFNFSRYNNYYDLLYDVFNLHNVFHFGLVLPLNFYESGLPQSIEHLNTFKDAITIINIIKNGHSFEFNDYHQQFMSVANKLSFMMANNLPEPYIYNPPIYREINLEP